MVRTFTRQRRLLFQDVGQDQGVGLELGGRRGYGTNVTSAGDLDVGEIQRGAICLRLDLAQRVLQTLDRPVLRFKAIQHVAGLAGILGQRLFEPIQLAGAYVTPALAGCARGRPWPCPAA